MSTDRAPARYYAVHDSDHGRLAVVDIESGNTVASAELPRPLVGVREAVTAALYELGWHPVGLWVSWFDGGYHTVYVERRGNTGK